MYLHLSPSLFLLQSIISALGRHNNKGISNPVSLCVRSILLFYIPLSYQAVLKLGPVQARSLLVPGAISTILGGFWGGLYIKKKGKYYNLFTTSNAILVLGSLPIPVLANSKVRFVQVASGLSVCLFVIGLVNGIQISSFHMALGGHLPSL